MEDIWITKNKIRLMELIQMFQYLPMKALARMAKVEGVYSFRQGVGRVVTNLERHDLVKSIYYGNNSKVLYLSAKGANFLTTQLGIEGRKLGYPNKGRKIRFATLEHTVRIADLYCEFMDELDRYPGIELVEWVGDQRCRYSYEFRSNRSGKKVRRILSPDSFIQIKKDKQVKNYFLEYDTGHMDKNQLAEKFMRYFEYFYYEDELKTFPSILFLTERSMRRIDNLLINPAVEIEKAINHRQHFNSSRNLLWKGIGLSENVRSMQSKKIREFLCHDFIFKNVNTSWARELLSTL